MNMKFVTGALLTALLLPSLAMAQTNTRATFAVTKTFADGNDVAEVVVEIDCNTGIILDQDKTLGDGGFVEFVVTDFTSGTLNCSISEADGPNGYSATLTGNGIEGGCVWEGVVDADANDCAIVNEPDEVEIVVTKDWIISGANNDVSLNFTLHLWCDNVFDPQGLTKSGSYYLVDSDGGEGESEDAGEVFTFKVRPGFEDSDCFVDETVFDSAIEVVNGCGNLTVSAGVGDSCTITNTVFFEGIPTLSQYGMAIMALLMLGVGFVGFRRFV